MAHCAQLEAQYDSWHAGQRSLLDIFQLIVGIVMSFYSLLYPIWTVPWPAKIPVVAYFITCSGLLILRLQNSAMYVKLRSPGMLTLYVPPSHPELLSALVPKTNVKRVKRVSICKCS